jgi:hypothetical protein
VVDQLADFQQVQANFTAHIRDPENQKIPPGIEPRRMKIYTELFFNNISDLLANGFPIIRSLFDNRRWSQIIRQFMLEHECSTPYFLELGQELIAWLELQMPKGELPPFLYELAHYEWVEVGLDIDEAQADYSTIDTNGDLLDGMPALSPLAWSLAYSYPVHQIGPNFQPDQPDAQPTYVVVYRDRLDKVCFMQSNAATAALLDLIARYDDLTGRQILTKLAEEMLHPNPIELTRAGTDILAKLQQLGIILGTYR